MFYRLDRNALLRYGTVAICLISLMHLYQTFLIAFWPVSIKATDMLALVKWGVFGADRFVLIIVMLITALLALVGALFRVGRPRIVFFFPQIILLAIQGLGGLDAALAGEYLDHTAIPWAHISADQIGYLILLGIHIEAVVWRARDPSG